MFLIRPAGANQNAKVAIGGGGPLLGSAIYGMPAGSSTPYTASEWFHYVPGLETSLAAINDGSLWFNNTGVARVFGIQAVNDSGRTADKVRLSLANAVALASEVRVCVGVGGSGYDADTWTTPTAPLALMAAGAGGDFEVGITVVEIDLPSPVAAGSRVVIRIEGGAGEAWTGISSWVTAAESTIVPGAQMASVGQDMVGTWSSSGLDLIMHGVGVQWHVTGDPIVRILAFGDSRTAGVPPLADASPNTRRSWPAGLNAAESANGQRFSVATWGEGGFAFSNYADRLEYLLDNAPDVLRQVCDIPAIDALSWNSFPTDAGATESIRDRLDTLRTKCNAAGLGFIVYVVTPPGASRQTAGHLAEYADWEAWFASTPYAVNMTAAVADSGTPTLLDAAKSIDGVHIDSDEGEAVGASQVSAWWAAIQAQEA